MEWNDIGSGKDNMYQYPYISESYSVWKRMTFIKKKPAITSTDKYVEVQVYTDL